MTRLVTSIRSVVLLRGLKYDKCKLLPPLLSIYPYTDKCRYVRSSRFAIFLFCLLCMLPFSTSNQFQKKFLYCKLVFGVTLLVIWCTFGSPFHKVPSFCSLRFRGSTLMRHINSLFIAPDSLSRFTHVPGPRPSLCRRVSCTEGTLSCTNPKTRTKNSYKRDTPVSETKEVEM